MKISIEGSIGCGKTTLLSRIQNETRLPVFLEPVTTWTLLDKFYENIERWAFTFNLEVLLSMSKWKHNKYTAFYERSPLACRQIFVAMNFEHNMLTKEELNIFDTLYKTYSWDQDIIIYIRTDPQVCYDRMKARNRNCEEKVSIQYLNDLHEKHESMMKYVSKNKPGISTYSIDGNRDANAVYEDVMKLLNTLDLNVDE